MADPEGGNGGEREAADMAPESQAGKSDSGPEEDQMGHKFFYTIQIAWTGRYILRVPEKRRACLG